MPSETSHVRSVARPKQRRSEQSLRRLLDAAESLILDRGFDGASIAEIARRADSSVGGFYARFRDKDELLLLLHERFVQQLEGALDQAISGPSAPADLDSLVGLCVRLMVETYADQHGLLCAFLARAGYNPDLASAGRNHRRELLQRIVGAIRTHDTEIGHPDPALAAELAVQFGLGLMEQSLQFGHPHAHGKALSGKTLQREIERCVLGYLQVQHRT